MKGEAERTDARGRDHPDVASSLNARVAIVAVIIVCQLWALTAALDAWLAGATGPVWWTLAFQGIAFLSSLLIWLASPRS